MPMRWMKGNTHTHTTNSDGDAPPDAVVAWYEEHGYDFLTLSHHNASMRFMEVFNGHPDAHNQGVEAKWDRLLSQGRRVYAVATDDAHHYQTFEPLRCNPGRGWIYVRAADARPNSILEAMHRGDFYTSTGIALAGYDVRGRELRVVLDGPESLSFRAARGIRHLESGFLTTFGMTKCVIELLGRWGEVLDAQSATEARFRIPSSEPYVRVRVSGEQGQRAWLQPVWV